MANKKSSYSLKSVFLAEGHLDKLQGNDVDTPRNVYTPDTSTNDNLVTVEPEDKLDGVSALGGEEGIKNEGTCPCGGHIPDDHSADMVVIKVGHHADDMSKHGHSAINIGRVGAPGSPNLSNSTGDTMIMHDSDEMMEEASMVGATGGATAEGSTLLTDEQSGPGDYEEEEPNNPWNYYPELDNEDDLIDLVNVYKEKEFDPKEFDRQERRDKERLDWEKEQEDLAWEENKLSHDMYNEVKDFDPEDDKRRREEERLSMEKDEEAWLRGQEDAHHERYDKYASEWKPRSRAMLRHSDFVKEGFYDTTKESSEKIKEVLKMSSRVMKALQDKKMSFSQAEKLINSLLYKMYDIGINEVEEEAGYNKPASN